MYAVPHWEAMLCHMFSSLWFYPRVGLYTHASALHRHSDYWKGCPRRPGASAPPVCRILPIAISLVLLFEAPVWRGRLVDSADFLLLLLCGVGSATGETAVHAAVPA